MPTIRARVSIVVDGMPIWQSPISRRIESPTQALEMAHLCPASASRTLNAALTTGIKAFAIQPDRDMTVQLLGQAVGAASVIEAGGLMLALDLNSVAGNIVGTNAATTQIGIRGIVAG